MKKAIFAAGCFWHVQFEFDKLKGVNKTTSGYTGGDEKKYPNPTYEIVCTGKTGYAEAVEVVYDDKIVIYEKLLDIFWKNHNPASLNKQGADVGTQYRAVSFYLDDNQKKLAEKSKKEIEKMSAPRKIYTSIEKAKTFYKAEEYHQKYLEKHGAGYCRF